MISVSSQNKTLLMNRINRASTIRSSTENLIRDQFLSAKRAREHLQHKLPVCQTQALTSAILHSLGVNPSEGRSSSLQALATGVSGNKHEQSMERWVSHPTIHPSAQAQAGSLAVLGNQKLCCKQQASATTSTSQALTAPT